MYPPRQKDSHQKSLFRAYQDFEKSSSSMKPVVQQRPQSSLLSSSKKKNNVDMFNNSSTKSHQKSKQGDDRYTTPKRKMSTQSGTRKFGQYGGASPTTPEHVKSAFGPDHSYSAFKPLQTGYEGGKATRVTNRFVRYPYPKLFSSYAQHHNQNKLKDTIVVSHKQAFNMEKESKIINPHKMERQTHNKEVHVGTKGEKAQLRKREEIKEERPINKHSTYSHAFPDWKNGNCDHFIEKAPQYPYYQEPFRAKTSYAQSFSGDKIKQLKEQSARVSKDQEKLNIVSYEPYSFGFETSNNMAYPDFKFTKPDRTQMIVPKVDCVKTKAPTGHFRTTSHKEHVSHANYQRPKVDLIPYP